MLNTSDVKSLSKGGTTVSLEEIGNSIDNKLSIDNLTGSNGIEIVKNTAGDKVEVGMSLPIVFSDASPGPGSGGTIIQGTYTSGYPAAAMIHLESPTYKTLISPVQIAMFGESAGHTYKLELAPTGIGYTYDGAAYSILRQDNVKTLFGNQQSIYGSGNIDLYRHNLYIHFECKSGSDTRQIQMYVQLISSSNTNIDSLTDLFSMFSNIKDIPASGTVTGGLGQNGVCVSVTEFSMSGKIITMLVDGGGVQYDISNATLHSIRDTVTTV